MVFSLFSGWSSQKREIEYNDLEEYLMLNNILERDWLSKVENGSNSSSKKVQIPQVFLALFKKTFVILPSLKKDLEMYTQQLGSIRSVIYKQKGLLEKIRSTELSPALKLAGFSSQEIPKVSESISSETELEIRTRITTNGMEEIREKWLKGQVISGKVPLLQKCLLRYLDFSKGGEFVNLKALINGLAEVLVLEKEFYYGFRNELDSLLMFYNQIRWQLGHPLSADFHHSASITFTVDEVESYIQALEFCKSSFYSNSTGMVLLELLHTDRGIPNLLKRIQGCYSKINFISSIIERNEKAEQALLKERDKVHDMINENKSEVASLKEILEGQLKIAIVENK